jgi:hypothetical protein
MARTTNAGWAVGAIAALLLAAPAHADDGAVDDRVRRLEEALKRQSEEMNRLRSDLEAYKASDRGPARLSEDEIRTAVDSYLASAPASSFPVAPQASPGGLHWGGYMTIEYVDNSETNSTFDLHRLVLEAGGSITDRIDFDMEIEFEHGGISGEIGGEIKVEQAVVRYRCSDAFTPKVGWVLIPFARYNLTHDDPLHDFTIRPWTARFLIPTGFGQPGIGAEGSIPVGCNVLSYDVVFTNGFDDDFSASSGVRAALNDRDTNDGKQVWGRVAMAWNGNRVFDYAETGVSGTWGLYDADDDNVFSGFALDWLLRKGPFEVKGEWIVYDIERSSGAPPDAVEGMAGLWVEAGYHFFPSFWRCTRNCVVTDTSLFTLAVRYQWTDLDDRNEGASFQDDLEGWSVGLNYRITENSVFRVDHTWFFPVNDDDRTEWTASFSTYF